MFNRLLIKFGASDFSPRGKYRLYKLLAGGAREIEGTTPRGVRMRFRPDDFTCYFYFRDSYEPELLRLIDELPVGGVFVDVGANMGNFSLLASRRVGPQGLVVSFEPVAETYSRFTRHVAMNGARNLVPCNAAVAASEGITEMVLSTDSGLSHIGRAAFDDPGGCSQRVATVSLDRFLPPVCNTRAIDLLKIDVEGAELGVLRGAARLLESGRIRRLHVEIGREHLARFGSTPQDIWEFLEARGYRARFRRADTPLYDEVFDHVGAAMPSRS